MKAILISIHPKWVEKILNGEKTIEVRKTAPKCELPIEVYIYQSKHKWIYKILKWLGLSQGKVVAMFTLNKIEHFDSAYSERAYAITPAGSEMPMSETQAVTLMEKQGCLTSNDIVDYFGYEDFTACFWHISDLQVFDKPKELGEFSVKCNKYNFFWGDWRNQCNCRGCTHYYENQLDSEFECWTSGMKQLTRPPQSWQFVESQS